MTTITYEIHLDEPAIFAALAGDPNAAITLPYIPGSVIRGMIISRHIRQQPTGYILDAGGPMKDLFFSPNTRYLNAYPAILGQRSLPIPSTWVRPKYLNSDELGANSPIAMHDSAFGPPRFGGGAQVKTKSMTGFAVIDGNHALVFNPDTVVNVHTARARPSMEKPQVFRYEALADGQTFKGAILCAGDDEAKAVFSLLSDDPVIVFGGSRTAGYGAATLTNVQLETTWIEVQHRISSSMILTLLSDALLKDGYGVYKPTPAMLQAHLEKLGVHGAIDPISVRTTWVGGFNRKWGLPLPQAIGIERGSVFRLTVPRDSEVALAELLSKGVGERREDGFGRVALGWQNDAVSTVAKYQIDSTAERPDLSDESRELWSFVRQRIRDRQLEERTKGILYDTNYTIYGNISRTQLSRLRTVIANELRKESPNTSVINGFLNEIRGKAAGRQFDNARIGNRNLSQWLQSPQFDELGGSTADKPTTILELVDAVLERAYRERDKQARQEAN